MKRKIVEEFQKWRAALVSSGALQSNNGPVRSNQAQKPLVVQDRAWKRERVSADDLFGPVPAPKDRAA